jgi:hypothetical protein
MKLTLSILCFAVLGAIAFARAPLQSANGTIPDPTTLPPPPSVAIGNKPLPPGTRISFQIDRIPADAKYVIHAQMSLEGLVLDDKNRAEIGRQISEQFNQLLDLAQEKEANLIVLLSNGKGVGVPIKQVDAELLLNKSNPVVTAILFSTEKTLRQRSRNREFTSPHTLLQKRSARCTIRSHWKSIQPAPTCPIGLMEISLVSFTTLRRTISIPST